MLKYKSIISSVLIIISLVIVSFSIDQISKKVIFIYFVLNSGGSINIFPMLQLILVFNEGVSFSLLSGVNPALITVISLIALLVIVSVLYFMFDFKRTMVRVAIGLIIGGSLGNIYDRISFGSVMDFIHVHYKSYSFPVFNIADVFINLSAIMLIIELYLQQKRKSKNNG